jgi:hypothetical protein
VKRVQRSRLSFDTLALVFGHVLEKHGVSGNSTLPPRTALAVTRD